MVPASRARAIYAKWRLRVCRQRLPAAPAGRQLCSSTGLPAPKVCYSLVSADLQPVMTTDRAAALVWPASWQKDDTPTVQPAEFGREELAVTDSRGTGESAYLMEHKKECRSQNGPFDE